MGDDDRALKDQFFSEKLADAEGAILKAQQEHPDDAEMFEIEARLWDNLRDKGKALRALERAWAKSPRGTSTAVRLGRMYAALGRDVDRLKVLAEAVNRDPENRPAHYALALHYLEESPPSFTNAQIHLSTCIAIDPSDFESKYMLAQINFASGDVARSVEMFDEINRKAPKNFRAHAPRKDNEITKHLPRYGGVIDVLRDNYAQIRSGAYPHKILFPFTSISDDIMEEIAIGKAMDFRIRFSRRGPVAVEVTFTPSERL